MGAVGCMQLAVEKSLGSDDAVLVVAGDTLFDDSFDLGSFMHVFEDYNEKVGPNRIISLSHDRKKNHNDFFKRFHRMN